MMELITGLFRSLKRILVFADTTLFGSTGYPSTAS